MDRPSFDHIITTLTTPTPQHVSVVPYLVNDPARTEAVVDTIGKAIITDAQTTQTPPGHVTATFLVANDANPATSIELINEIRSWADDNQWQTNLDTMAAAATNGAAVIVAIVATPEPMALTIDAIAAR